MTDTAMVVAVLYYRVSTEDQAKTGYSLPDQRALCQQKAQELRRSLESNGKSDLHIVEFTDTIGGDILERPVLEQVRTYVREQKPAYFVCLDPDRFSRSLKWQLLVADEIEDRGTRLVFVQQEYDPDDMMSRAFFQFRGLMSELDKAKIKDRTSRGARGKLKAGQLSHGVPTYGYRYNKEKDILDVYEPEALIVKRIFEWASERIMPSEIRDRLNTLGVPPRRGQQWYSSTIQNMLRNETYVGRMWCNRYMTEGNYQLSQLPKAIRKRKIAQPERPREQWILLNVTPIIEPALFLNVHQTFRTQKRQAQRGKGLLSGLCRCGSCGGAVNYILHNNKDYNLRCVNKYPNGRDIRVRPPKCDLPHTRASIIEKLIWQQIEQAILHPESLLRHRETQQATKHVERKIDKTRGEVAELQKRLIAKRREQVIVLAEKAKGYVDAEVYATVMADLKAQIDALQISIRQTESRVLALTEAAASGENMRAYLMDIKRQLAEDETTLRAILCDLKDEGRQHLVRQLVREVIVHPFRKCDIVWMKPPSVVQNR